VIELTPGVERLDRDVILRFQVGDAGSGGHPRGKLVMALNRDSG
jgi:hypothetical protein